MIENKEFARFINDLAELNIPFALWSLPGENNPEIIISDSGKVMPLKPEKLNGEEGFVFAPYRIGKTEPLVLMKPGIYKSGLKEILKINLQNFTASEYFQPSDNHRFIIEREAYIKEVESAVNEFSRTKLSKVIISRLIPHNRKGESVGEVYVQLLKQTPNAFVYLVNLPASADEHSMPGLWMGATPEVLLRSEGKTLETVSLAGTQSRKPVNNYGWHTKEIEEQAFVSRYILDVFYKFGIHPFTTRGPETVESGKVAHLATSFRFAAKKLDANLGDFVAELHPTPAICGYPKQKADKFIFKTEKHSRRYYSGYLGPWRLNGEVGLFVNLRCMEIFPEKYILYSGAGITARSIPEKEWEETGNKSTTLLSAIETVQNR